MNVDEASFLHKHYGMIAGLTSAGDKIFGIASDAGEKYFKAIERTLLQIETTYQNQYRTQGMLISDQFFARRKLLLAELSELVNKPLLKSLTRYTVKLRPYDEMRRALNLSSRSIVHQWAASGIAGIPGYSFYTDNAAKMARYLKTGGLVGIGFAFTGTTNEVFKACTTGREHECGKVAFKEYSKFMLSTRAGISGGYLGGSAGVGICVALGIATGGAGGVACAAVGAMAGGYAASQATEIMIDGIYNYVGK